MKNSRSLIYLLGCLPLLAGGCEVKCNPILLPGIRLMIVDSVTAAVPTAPSITVVARAGTFKDSVQVLQAHASGEIFLANERGNYRLEITAAGYKPWVMSDIRVTGDEGCPVNTVDVLARLQPITVSHGDAGVAERQSRRTAG